MLGVANVLLDGQGGRRRTAPRPPPRRAQRVKPASATEADSSRSSGSGVAARSRIATGGQPGDRGRRSQVPDGLAQLPGQREVLVLVDGAHLFDARRRGASRATTAWTSSSGADAPAMTPTVPARSSGSSSGPLTRSTRGQPAAGAVRSRARVLDELAEPMTTTASQRPRWP